MLFAAGTYFAVSMVLVGLSLVLAVLVLNVHHRGDIPGKAVPSWARRLFLTGCWCTKDNKYSTSSNKSHSFRMQTVKNNGINYEV